MGGGPPCFPRGSPCPAVLGVRLGADRISPTGFLPSLMGRSRPLRLSRPFLTPYETPHNPRHSTQTHYAYDKCVLWISVECRVWAVSVSLAATQEIALSTHERFPFAGPALLSFPQGTKMFQFPWLPSAAYAFSNGCSPMKESGFPHSDIPGSTPAYGSPRHFGVRPVLRRLLAPRHPPCALSRLIVLDMTLVIPVNASDPVFKEHIRPSTGRQRPFSSENVSLKTKRTSRTPFFTP